MSILNSIRNKLDNWMYKGAYISVDVLKHKLSMEMDEKAVRSSSSPPLVDACYQIRLPLNIPGEIKNISSEEIETYLREHAQQSNYQPDGPIKVEILLEEHITQLIVVSSPSPGGTLLKASGHLGLLNAQGECYDSCPIFGEVAFRRAINNQFSWSRDAENRDKQYVDIPDNQISKNHATLRYANNQYVFKDESANGSKVDDNYINKSEVEISYGSIIGLGSYNFVLKRLVPLIGEFCFSEPDFDNQVYLLAADRVRRIGRSPECEIIVPPIMQDVSRIHAMLIGEEQGFMLLDANSKNGTRVIRGADELIVSGAGSLLQDADTIVLGQSYRLKYSSKGD